MRTTDARRRAQRVFNKDGGELDDVELIENNDVLYISSGEDFLPTGANEGKTPDKSESSVQNYKIACIGPGGVGKSALTLRYCQGVFVSVYDPTIEDAYRKSQEIDGEMVHLDILDTAGQEDYVALRTQWMRERQGFLLVYSMTDRQSYEDIIPFWEQLQDVHADDDQIPVIVVANKSDMKDQREVSEREGHDLCKMCGNAKYVETSAKSGQNIDKAFASLIKIVRRVEDAKAAAAGEAPRKKPAKKKKCLIL